MAVIKLLTRHSPSYESLIKYILRERNSHVFTHNLRGSTIKEWVQEYKRCEAYRAHPRSNQIYLYHEIISFSPEDSKKLTPEILQDITRKYIELRGDKGLVVGAFHFDKEHTHIHLCTSGVELYTGKAMRLSKFRLKDLKQNLQAYHLGKYPELSHSTCNHGSGKAKTNDRKWYVERREEAKRQIEQAVFSCFKQARSRQDFLNRLQSRDLHYYERNGIPTGIISGNGIKFRFSRLGIDLTTLPEDRREINKTLNDIRAIRQSLDREEIRSFDR